MRSYDCENELRILLVEWNHHLFREEILTQRIKPIALGRNIEARIPAAAASIPFPGHVDNAIVSTGVVEKAGEAEVESD